MFTYLKNNKSAFCIVLFLFLFISVSPAKAQGTIQKNENGTYSYIEDGVAIRNQWIKVDGKVYYSNAQGNFYTCGIYTIGSEKYAFNRDGALMKGRKTIRGNTYYFGTLTGKMIKNRWVLTKGKYQYFGSNGVMLKNQWIGRYYVGKYGTRLKNCWIYGRYLGSNGKAYIGLHKIGSYYYYFQKSTYEKITNKTLKIKNVNYKFDENGRGSVVINNTVPVTSVNVENTYYTDPYVDDETLLAAIIYCEAGNQPYYGQVAVGMVIMNRVYSVLFPSKLREIVYQKMQFAPARDGNLTRSLKGQMVVTESCKQAAAEVMKKYEGYTPGKRVTLNINGKNVNFSSYLFFMTRPAFQGLGLRSIVKQLGDHVFFQLWK